jgi:plasmid maintenance system antidote protein VapI
VIGGSPLTWLRMQEAVDLWEAEQKLKTQIKNKLTPIKLLAA